MCEEAIAVKRRRRKKEKTGDGKNDRRRKKRNKEGERTGVDKSLLPFHWVTNLTVGRERKEESEREEK